MPIVHEQIHAPEFQSGDWLNAPPATMASLRGRVVMVDFWDYACINCLRTLPYQLEWRRRYHRHGLVLIGVHTPQFDFGRQSAFVRQALERYDIEYPVLLDAEHRTWDAWANRFWPTKYLIDADGCVRYFHYGQGDYLALERAIQQCLLRLDPSLLLPAPMRPLRGDDAPGARCYQVTPDLYLGYGRGQVANREGLQPERIIDYPPVEATEPDQPYLAGRWADEREAVVLIGNVGEISVAYRAKEVYAILAAGAEQPGRILIEQDGAPLPASAYGDDVHAEGGMAGVTVTTPRLYSLVRNAHYDMGTLRVRCVTPRIACFALSFTSECLGGEAWGAAA